MATVWRSQDAGDERKNHDENSVGTVPLRSSALAELLCVAVLLLIVVHADGRAADLEYLQTMEAQVFQMGSVCEAARQGALYSVLL